MACMARVVAAVLPQHFSEVWGVPRHTEKGGEGLKRVEGYEHPIRGRER